MKMLAVCALAVLAGSAPAAFAEEIPDWVRDVAALWGAGQISDDEFIGAMQYLADQGFIRIDSGVAPLMREEAGGLPHEIGPEFVKSASSAECTLLLKGITIDTSSSSERYVLEMQARSTAGEDVCVMATHLHGLRGISDTILGGILLHHSTHPEPTVLYVQWNHFSAPTGEWTFASDPDGPRSSVTGEYDESWDELESLELIFYDVSRIVRDEAGTIFFGNLDRTSQIIALEPSDVSLR